MAIQKELIQALAQSDAFAEMLENRMKGFWNTDYFEKISNTATSPSRTVVLCYYYTFICLRFHLL